MSFWPFSNSIGNNSQLQKFLDSVQDFSSVSADDLILDATLSQELINELHQIKGNYNNNLEALQFSQQIQGNEGSYNSSSDVASISSSNNEGNSNNHGKDPRGAKLLEILLQPHILNGFLDYIYSSIDFYHKISIEEQKKIEKQLKRSNDLSNSTERSSIEIEIEEAEESTNNEEESSDDKLSRCIQVSSDILSIDLWVISNRIIETPIIINKLWSIISLPNLEEGSPSISYLIHILDQLMDTNSIELLNFIRRQPNLVDTFLDKIEIPVLMDFFLRVIQTDKVDSPTGILEALSSQNLIPKLIDILKPDASQFVEDSLSIPNPNLFFKQAAATDFIKALVTLSSNTALAVVLETNIGPNQLTRELVSPDIINIIINDIMLYKFPDISSRSDRINKHGINNCVGIIIELIRKNNSDYDLNCGSYSSLLQNGDTGVGEVNSFVMFQWLKDFEQNPPGPRDPIYLGDMLSLFSENLNKFAELMDLESSNPPNPDSKVLGLARFKVSELIAELLHCSNMILLNSKKIHKVVQIRDHIRLQQSKRLKYALSESLLTTDDESINNVTNGLDDVFLDEIERKDTDKVNSLNNSENYANLLDLLDTVDDSDDEEPSISPENPFVCDKRDTKIRQDPFIGDYFKIKLIDSKILVNIISKFAMYSWHNFFHNVVFDLIQQIFNGKLNSYNSFLIVDLFRKKSCDLTNLIISSYQNNEEPRPGYMGHLILISEEVVKFTSLYKPDLISPVIVESVISKDWEWFVDEVLLKTREVYNVVLGAEHDDNSMIRDDTDEYGFDSSTVGFLDLDAYENRGSKKNTIILGDQSNHETFINDKDPQDEIIEGEEGDDESEGANDGLEVDNSSNDNVHDDDDDDDNDEKLGESRMPDLRMENVSPHSSMAFDVDDEAYGIENYQDYYQESDFLENLSGSSSSEDDIDKNAELDGTEDNNDNNESGHELYRVSKHTE